MFITLSFSQCTNKGNKGDRGDRGDLGPQGVKGSRKNPVQFAKNI